MQDRGKQKRSRADPNTPEPEGPPKKKLAIGADESALLEMPQEIRDLILKYIAMSGGPRESTSALTAYRRVSKRLKRELEAVDPVRDYLEQANEAGKAVKTKYSKLPRDWLNPNDSATAADYVDMISSGFGFLPESKQRNFLAQIQYEGRERSAFLINRLASSFTPTSRPPPFVIDAAIDLISLPPGDHTPHACKAVAKLFENCSEAQKARVAQLKLDPVVSALVDSELDMVATGSGNTTMENTPRPSPEPDEATPTRRQLLRDAKEDTILKIQRAEDARRTLQNSLREREGRG